MPMPMPMTWTERSARHHTLSNRLATLDDDQILALLGTASSTAAGIGGTTASVRIDGVPVFVKRVRLTDLERRPEHVGSTRNLFELPMFYQYGIGSAGFGVWREVAVQRMASEWALTGRYPGFPILYHWRILPRPAGPPMEPAELARWVARWDGSAPIRARLTALSEATASVLLFLENLPQTVDAWLTERALLGAEASVAAHRLVERELRAGVAFLAGRGLLHFDAHFRNLLTDGRRIYFSDFGLALSARFDLTDVESAFLHQHQTYDRCYAITSVTHSLVGRTLGLSWRECHDYLRADAGRRWPDLPPVIARVVARNARVAVILGEFFQELERDKATPYPAVALDRALAERPPR